MPSARAPNSSSAKRTKRLNNTPFIGEPLATPPAPRLPPPVRSFGCARSAARVNRRIDLIRERDADGAREESPARVEYSPARVMGGRRRRLYVPPPAIVGSRG